MGIPCWSKYSIIIHVQAKASFADDLGNLLLACCHVGGGGGAGGGRGSAGLIATVTVFLRFADPPISRRPYTHSLETITKPSFMY